MGQSGVQDGGGHWRQLCVDRISPLTVRSDSRIVHSAESAWAVAVVMLLVGGLPVSELLLLVTGLWMVCVPGYRERMDHQPCINLDG